MANHPPAKIGERGVTLSGGQKARLGLARVVYSSADIVILDDPLAAVDSHVAKQLIEECLCGVLATKTRILVTHHLDVLPRADRIIVLQDGKIVQQGTYGGLQATTTGPFKELIHEFGVREKDTQAEASENSQRVERPDITSAPLDLKKKDGEVMQLMEDEDRFTGAVTWTVYRKYFAFMGSPLWLLLVLALMVACQVSSVGTSLFLGWWSEESVKGFRLGDYIAVYGSLGIAQGLILVVVCPLLGTRALRASFRMFEVAINHVLRSPLRFFDQNPIGRLISRLSKDVEHIDAFLGFQLFYVLTRVLDVFGAFALVLYIYPYLGLAFIPLSAIYIWTSIFYKKTSVESKRLDSLARSYVYSAFSEQLNGMACIRAHQQQPVFIAKFQQAADLENRAYYIQAIMQRWISIRAGFYGNVLVLGVALFGVGYRKSVSPAKLGVVLTYAMQTVNYLANLISEYVLLENCMNYVERIFHYIGLQTEAAPALPSDPPSSWPDSGRVEFQDVKMRYRKELPIVLKGVTFVAEAGQKIGIVGRTGAGKSSLLQVLLRLVELADGKILVDGVDIATVGLDTLRTQLSAIPQDPLIFGGTMRENLDPSGTLSDSYLNDVLHKCSLIATSESPQHEISRLEKFKLDAEVHTGGANFSAGECQLVALARAIVKNSKVILLDEATSSVDPETDATIQRTIRTQFGDKTILCIAHRLATVAFYDKILVLDQGKVLEQASPLELYDRTDSVFRSMCDAAGLTREGICRIRDRGM